MYFSRLEKLRKHLFEQQTDAFIITNFYNILYFTGFKTLVPHEREAFLMVTKKHVYVLSDGRYLNNFKFQISKFKSTSQSSNLFEFKLLTSEKGLIKHLQEIITEEKITRLGFEKEDLKWSEYQAFQKSLEVELIPQDRVGAKMRVAKEQEEIKKIQKACEIGDECLGDIIKVLHLRMTEKEIAWKIEQWIRDRGYEIGFDPIVAVDANSAVPHYDTKSGTGCLKRGSIVLIDMGVRYEGYNSDITRMFFMGKQPDEVVKTYESLRNAQEKTVQQILYLKKPVHIDAYCRKLLQATYPHSTGHGVGLEVHEYPKISLISDDVLQAGNVFTVEPGIYYPGKWGMRIEDTVVISSDFHPQVLTRYPKELHFL